MMNRIELPATDVEYDARMEMTGALQTAIGWERAALVAMKVEPGIGSGTHSKLKGSLISATEYAGRNYHGLRSPATVLVYAHAWLDRFPRPKYGESIVLPTEPFPPTRQGTDGFESTDGAKATLDRLVDKHGASVIGDAIRESPEIAEIAAKALTDRVRDEMPFDEPPAMPWSEKVRESINLSQALYEIEPLIERAIYELSQYTFGTDPVVDQALANSLDQVEEYQQALREAMGLGVMS